MQQSSPEGTESEFASEPIDRPPSVSSPSQVFKMNAHTHKHLYVHTRVTKSCNFVLNFKLNFHNKFALHFFFHSKNSQRTPLSNHHQESFSPSEPQHSSSPRYQNQRSQQSYEVRCRKAFIFAHRQAISFLCFHLENHSIELK